MINCDSGILLWVDDDFEHEEQFGEGRDIDVWSHIFGDADSGIYRLLDLKLVIAENATTATELAERLTSREFAGCYVQGVLDMRIPKQKGGRPEKKFGLETASYFKKLGIDISILSSKAESQKDLVIWGLEGTNYNTKRPAPNTTMMPDDLTRRVLANFRSRISWIDIKPLLDRWDKSARFSHPLKPTDGQSDAPEVAHSFPFFSSCRDFVERWEARQTTVRHTKNPRVVLRAPEFHSDEFITQCCAIIIGGRDFDRDVSVVYIHGNDLQAAAVLGADDIDVRIIRFHANTPTETEREVNILRNLLSQHYREQFIFILPQDERAEPFLEIFSYEDEVIFDDLPSIKINDMKERENYIRKIAKYYLTKAVISMDGSEVGYVNKFYREHPETLFDPIYWTLLLESEAVAAELTDPYEMQAAIHGELLKIHEWDGESRQRLIDGQALSVDRLLQPGKAIFEQYPDRHLHWATVTFNDWLVNSWRTPYGCIDIRRDGLDDRRLKEWEWLCLLMAQRLAQHYKDKSLLAGKALDSTLGQATEFILTDAITKVIAGDVQQANWAGIETLRWPHAYCPMPSALNARLKEEGRYLLIQSDLLDRATFTRNGSRNMLRIEEYAKLQDERLLSIERNLPYLPKGWSEAAAQILSSIRSGDCSSPAFGLAHLDPKLWYAIQCIAKNATISSYLFHMALDNSDGLQDSKIKILTGLEDKPSEGEGRLLGNIRLHRTRHLSGIMMPPRSHMRTLSRDIQQLRFLSTSLLAFNAHEKHKGMTTITTAFNELIELLANLPDDYYENSTAEELKNFLDKQSEVMVPSLFEDDSSLNKSDFFDKDFKFPAALQNLAVGAPSMRGTSLDLLFWLFEWSDLACWSLRPLQYSDGYHFLSVVRDLRNNGKDHVPNLSNEVLSNTIELFTFGFDGLTKQLQYCLALSGHKDRAEELKPLFETMPLDEVVPDPKMKKVMNIVDLPDGQYELYQKGYPGQQSDTFSYLDETLKLVKPHE
ncbi:MAG: hypothetical protein ABJN24_01060 [Hyphomicrobiales bacterium]